MKISRWLSAPHPILECLVTIFGGLLYAVALNYFVFPSKIILTGFEGIAAATAYFFDDSRLFLLIYVAAQTILIVFAFIKISKTFAFQTLLTVATVTVALVFLPDLEFASPEADDERIILVLFGGILAGLAKAITLRMRGSTGDEDILGAWFAMRYLKPVGNIAIAAACVSTVYGLVLTYLETERIEPVVNTLMYTSIYIFTSAETLNNFFRKFKLVLLTAFGSDAETLGKCVTDIAPHRTYTVQKSVGGFSSEEFTLVRTIITHEELPDILNAIQQNCPEAFWFHHDIEGISNRYYIKPIG